jgi:kynurenine 3-monooxygenase
MVTFRPDMRYSEALERGNFQQKIMDEVMALENIEEKWNSVEVEKMILEKISG